MWWFYIILSHTARVGKLYYFMTRCIMLQCLNTKNLWQHKNNTKHRWKLLHTFFSYTAPTSSLFLWMITLFSSRICCRHSARRFSYSRCRRLLTSSISTRRRLAASSVSWSRQQFHFTMKHDYEQWITNSNQKKKTRVYYCWHLSRKLSVTRQHSNTSNSDISHVFSIISKSAKTWCILLDMLLCIFCISYILCKLAILSSLSLYCAY